MGNSELMKKSKPDLKSGRELWESFREDLLNEIVSDSGPDQLPDDFRNKEISDLLNKYEFRIERKLNFFPMNKRLLLLEYWLHSIMIESEKPVMFENSFSNKQRFKYLYSTVSSWKDRVDQQFLPTFDWNEYDYYLPLLFLGLEKMGVLKSLDSSGNQVDFKEVRMYTALGKLFPLLKVSENGRVWVSEKAKPSKNKDMEISIINFTDRLGDAMSGVLVEKGKKKE